MKDFLRAAVIVLGLLIGLAVMQEREDAALYETPAAIE